MNFDYKFEPLTYSEAYNNSLSRGNDPHVAEISTIIRKVAEYGGAFCSGMVSTSIPGFFGGVVIMMSNNALGNVVQKTMEFILPSNKNIEGFLDIIKNYNPDSFVYYNAFPDKYVPRVDLKSTTSVVLNPERNIDATFNIPDIDALSFYKSCLSLISLLFKLQKSSYIRARGLIFYVHNDHKIIFIIMI